MVSLSDVTLNFVLQRTFEFCLLLVKKKKEIYLWFLIKSLMIFSMSILEAKGLPDLLRKMHTYAVTNLAEHAWQLITYLIHIKLKRKKIFKN